MLRALCQHAGPRAFPTLQTLCVSKGGADVPAEIDTGNISFPSLHFLELSGMTIRPNTSIMENVETLHLSGTIMSFSSFQVLLHNAPKLVSLSADAVSGERLPPSLPLSPFKLPCLESVFINDANEDVVRAILGFSHCPRLQILEIDHVDCDGEPIGTPWSHHPPAGGDMVSSIANSLYNTVSTHVHLHVRV